MEEIEKLFSVQNYNLIQDEEYYYFFRALNNGDHNDIQAGITRDENGVLTKIRTDRARYIENIENPEPIYSENEPVSLVQVIDHIKRGHRYDTNCISLSSNSNVSVIYGNGYYNDEYAIVKVAKNKFREKTINASEYILLEMEKRIQQALENANDDVKELIENVDSATTREELLEIIANSYKLPKLNEDGEEKTAKFTADIGTAKSKIPAKGRFSNYTTLNDEQNLLKNKIVAKLTLLEERKIMKPIMPHTKLDSKAIETLGMAISSSELIHYGEINAVDENGEAQMFEVSKETIHILGLLQQAIERNPNLAEKVHQMENEIVKQAIEGKKIDEQIIELLKLENTESNLPSISIKQAFEITNGKLQYEDAQETLEKIFYLSRAVSNARNYSRAINKLTGEDSNNAEVIETISKFGLDVEPKLMNKKGKSVYKISESVGIPLIRHEDGLIEAIQNMSTAGIEDIIRDADNSKTAINSLSNLQNEPQIPIDEYYARAIFSKYNWEEQRIHFTQAHKESFIKKLQERQIANIYESLASARINENSIPLIIMNLITLDREDTNNILDEIEQGNIRNEIVNQLQSDENEFIQPLQIEQLEDYLDFYKVEGTDIKLRDYQQSAINNVHNIFETHRFASVILPTGAGKSFVAIAELLKMQEQIEKGSDEKILYLAPSNEILEQIKKYTEKYVHGEKIDKTRDVIFKEIFPNIELATYSSLLQKEDEKLQAQKCKFIVLDELHRTGAEQWGEKLNTLLNAQDESVRVLGITATPQRDVDGRNMADEIAERLGFSEQEIKNRKHIAKKMDLIDAIRLGIVVNPKIVECEYTVKNDTETWESLLATLNEMDEGTEKDEYLRKFDELRGKLSQAKEIPELLRDNIVKKDGRYIFYMPIGVNEYEEDEEGNVIGKKTGADKVKQAEEQLREWLKYVDGEPEFYSMLGEYGDKKNAQKLEQFEKSTSSHTKIMIVMNKLNEGVHVDGINGIIWQRAVDENSRILLLQQLGRAIYSPEEGEDISEEDRPVIIDLANNLTRVDINKVINSYDEIDDVELLQNVIDWVNEHEGILPDINAGFREEARLASTLKRVQKKYIKYNKDEEFEKLDEERAEKVDAILELGSEIDLWDIKLPDKEKGDGAAGRGIGEKDSLYEFALNGVVKEFSDFIKASNRTLTSFEKVMKWAEENGRIPKKIKKKATEMSVEEKEEDSLNHKWRRSLEKNKVDQYTGIKLENIPEEDRELVERIRQLGYGLTPFEKVMKWAEENGRIPKQIKKKAIEMSVEEKEEMSLYYKWLSSSEKNKVDQYNGVKLEDISEEDRELVEKIRQLGYNGSVKSQNIGQKTFDSSAQLCAEASTIITNLVKEKQKNQQLQDKTNSK